MTAMNKGNDRATWLPLALLAYLAVMAYMGRSMLSNGEELRYWLSVGGGVAIIAVLRWVLLRQRRLREEHEDEARPNDGQDP